jgi:hypothetical protein
MPFGRIDARYIRHVEDRLCQGDIVRDIRLVTWAEQTADSDNIQITEKEIPYGVVMTQDCDLEQDKQNRSSAESKNQDKFLQSVLLCPAYPAADIRAGTHLSDENLVMERLNSDRWKVVKGNNNARYHYLPEHPDYQIPESVIDFKHYFTVPREKISTTLKLQRRIGSVGELFREDLSLRFAQYLSRIGLPDLR